MFEQNIQDSNLAHICLRTKKETQMQQWQQLQTWLPEIPGQGKKGVQRVTTDPNDLIQSDDEEVPPRMETHQGY